MAKKKTSQLCAEKGGDACRCCGGSGQVVIIGKCPLCDGAGHFASELVIVKAPALSNKAAKRRALDISQCLSVLLRHNAREKGIAIDEQGWVSFADALAFVNDVDEDDPWEGGLVTGDEVESIVQSSDKQRFQICQQTQQIRAVQGHTMEGIEPDLIPVDLQSIPVAVHGTYCEAWESIKTGGVSRMSRNHIHMARDLPGESGVISGMRWSCQVLIWIDLVRAAEAGIQFVQSANGVILSKGMDGVISPEFFVRVLDRQSGASLL